MIECRVCHGRIAGSAKACPHCGGDCPNVSRLKSKYYALALALLVICLCLGYTAMNTTGWLRVASGGFALFLVLPAIGSIRHAVRGTHEDDVAS